MNLIHPFRQIQRRGQIAHLFGRKGYLLHLVRARVQLLYCYTFSKAVDDDILLQRLGAFVHQSNNRRVEFMLNRKHATRVPGARAQCNPLNRNPAVAILLTPRYGFSNGVAVSKEYECAV